MKHLLAVIVLMFGSMAYAADPALKFSLDDNGYGRLAPDLAKGTAYVLQPYSASDGSLILGMAYIDAGRPKMAIYVLPPASCRPGMCLTYYRLGQNIDGTFPP